jgi:hypothetical protein
MLSASRPSFKPRFNFGFNTSQPIPILPSQKTAWQRAVWNSDMPCAVKGFLQNLAVGWMDAEGGSCYPSEEQIMERLGCSRPALTRWIRIAEQAGFLEVTRYGRGLKNRRYNYQATFPCAAPGIGTNLSDPPGGMGKNLSDHEPCPNYNHEKREAAPEPVADPLPPIGAHSDFASHQEQERPATATVIPLPSKTLLPEDWQLPEDYRAWASKMRPDLSDRLDAIASNFADYHASKATRSASWIAEWRRWINRERAVKPPPNADKAANTPSRYAHLDLPEKPVSAAVRASFEASEQRRIEQLRAHGIDPVTGLKMTDPPPPTSALPDGEPLPAGRSESAEEYAARFEQHRQFQLGRLAAMVAARKAQAEGGL